MLILCLWLLIFLWCLSQKKEWKTAENGSTNQARQFQEDEVCAGQRPVPFTNRKGSFSEGETGLSPLKRSYYETTIRSVFSSRVWRAFRWAAFFFPSSSSSSSSCPARDKSCPLSFSRFTGGGRGVSINGENRWHLKPRERVAVFFRPEPVAILCHVKYQIQDRWRGRGSVWRATLKKGWVYGWSFSLRTQLETRHQLGVRFKRKSADYAAVGYAGKKVSFAQCVLFLILLL